LPINTPGLIEKSVSYSDTFPGSAHRIVLSPNHHEIATHGSYRAAAANA
jgi:hypothetical protein